MYVQINENSYLAQEGETILELCKRHGIPVPTLCYHTDLKTEARCRICIVEVDGKIQSSCNTMVSEGMNIKTDTPVIRHHRQTNLDLLTSEDSELLINNKSASEFQDVVNFVFNGDDKQNFYTKDEAYYQDVNDALVRDSRQCILCGKCVQMCREIQGIEAIGFTHRSYESRICPAFEHPMADVACALCGQCANVCPTGAIRERSYLDGVKEAINDPEKTVIVQTAPAVRASIGETQAIPPGTLLTNKLTTALRQLGFDRVLDTNFAADLTIVEEGTEFIERLHANGPFPLITSCSPGWIRFVEFFYPELLPNVSSCKSPQQMFGSIVKTYYAQQNNIDPENLVSVSIMPCTAKKFEMNRDEMADSGYKDVDYVLTTRELGEWLNQENIDLLKLEESDYDPLMGRSTGAAAIFGATGGVMEAALRSVADLVASEDLPSFEYEMVRGLEGVKEAELSINDQKIRIAVAHGLLNARNVMESIKSGKKQYHFVEIMGCPGGCIGGGGQPKPSNKSILKKRTEALYTADRNLPYRKSHLNPEIQKLYKDFLGEPGSEKSHKLLHTRYVNRQKQLEESRPMSANPS